MKFNSHIETLNIKTKQVILMLAARQGRLPDIIIALLDYGEDPSGYRAGKTLLRNLKSLLVFWQEHYLHKVSKSLLMHFFDFLTHLLLGQGL